MTLTPWRLIHRGAVGGSLLLAVTAFAAPGLAAPARAAAPTSSTATCTAAAAGSTARAAIYAGTGSRTASTRPDDGVSVSRAVAAAVQSRMRDRVSARTAQSLPNNSISIPVVAHILVGTKKHAGHMTKAGVRAQIAVLNQAYSGGEGPGVDTPFRFRIKKIVKTRKQKWYRLKFDPQTGDVPGGNAMKRALHRGTSRTLNLYFVKFAALGDSNKTLLGYSTFPWDAHGKGLKRDGVIIDYRTRSGGEYTGFNQGDTAVHEVGHWLGLLHTFEGSDQGCAGDPSASGDYVADTPAESVPTDGCPADNTKNTCPTALTAAQQAGPLPEGDPGYDPIHNFMDYATDACMFQFTPGQAERMSQAWLAFRA